MTSNARKHQFMKLLVSIIRNCLYQSLGLPNVSQQEGVLGLKMRSPITVILERGEGFFRRLRVESFPHLGKEQIKGRKTGANNIKADAYRSKQMDRQTVSLVDIDVFKKGK